MQIFKITLQQKKAERGGGGGEKPFELFPRRSPRFHCKLHSETVSQHRTKQSAQTDERRERMRC